MVKGQDASGILEQSVVVFNDRFVQPDTEIVQDEISTDLFTSPGYDETGPKIREEADQPLAR